ncbi:MAG TPA: M28 family peptidase [bacterium]|nr:M28 family peptidase [bacterium]HPN43973.1 M28 family peptidase [bacterium]
MKIYSIAACRKLLLLSVLLTPYISFPQNQPPVIDRLTASVDTTTQIITFLYDVSDQENDTLEISISFSSDSGRTFLCPMDSLGGDIGWPVLPGTDKQITWHYPARTFFFTATTLSSYKARLSADDHLAVKLEVLADQVDSLQLKTNMQAIIGIRNYVTGAEHLANVKEFLKNRLSAGNLELLVQSFEQDECSAENIIGMLTGQTNKEILYGIGGHYDTVENSPGADDNGSAVAGMLEAARILSAYQFRNSLHFIAFDLEETGMYGSKEYVRLLRQDSTHFEGLVNMDMIGYYSNEPNSQDMRPEYEDFFPEAYHAIAADEFRANFVMVITNAVSSYMQVTFNNSANLFVPQLNVLSFAVPGNGEDVSRLRSSDHASFWDWDFKAIMLTDSGNLRNHIYHSPADTIGTLNFTFMTNIVKAAVVTMARLGEIQHYNTKVTDLVIANTTAIAGMENTKPVQYRLEQNYPNPFNPSTRIDYCVPKAGQVEIKIFSVTGREVQTLVQSLHQTGSYSINFNASALPCGIYLYTLQTGNHILDCKKMLLIK